jgi:hypothetical protein
MSDNYFVALGKLGKALNGINTFRGTTLPGYAAVIPAQTDFQTYPVVGSEIVDAINSLAMSNQIKTSQIGLQTAADDLLLSVVNTITGNSALTDPTVAIAYLVATTADTIGQNVVSATPAAFSGNVGTGVIVYSLLRDDGMAFQFCLAEIIRVACTDDALTGRSASGSEKFTVSGAPMQKDQLAANYPQGSGSTNTIVSADANIYNAATNLTNNGNFEGWSANIPHQFTVITGTAGTEIIQDTSHVYAGASSVNMVGNTGTNLVFEQLFGNATTGTAGTLLPETHYAFNIFARASGALGSGSFVVELYDKTNAAVMNDASATPNSVTILCTALTTSYAAFHGVFRTPKSLPASYSLRIACTSVPAGNVYLDNLALTEMTRLYSGGQALAIFSSNVPWVSGDGWNVTVANNYACAWTTMLQRLYDLNSQQLIFPNSVSPSQADALLT